MTQADPRVWTVTEAKARLSEILRLSEEEGPQRIGTRKSFVVVPRAYGRVTILLPRVTPCRANLLDNG